MDGNQTSVMYIGMLYIDIIHLFAMFIRLINIVMMMMMMMMFICMWLDIWYLELSREPRHVAQQTRCQNVGLRNGHCLGTISSGCVF